MVFAGFVFLFLFLPILMGIYYLVPGKYRSVRNGILLVFSIIFYGWSGPKYLLLLAASVLINWFGGVLIRLFREEKNAFWKKFSLFVVVVANCALFGIFKYTDFVISNINIMFECNLSLRNIVLPVGISFYTFQGMSYVFDVYKDNKLYLKNPLTVALYIILFPQLVAGPIVRFADVAEDIRSRNESIEKIVEGLQRFVLGLAKKIILADTFGILADQAFSSPHLTMGLAWIGAVAYTLQIYFDFCGYSDMAIGLGKVFGFQFCENFNYPYISVSITDFWRRWHISLSTWFRDYIYIPLGGNRCGKGRQIFNMAVVWSLTGLWHGASWNYVLWGGYYLIWLVLEKYVFRNHFEKIPVFIRQVFTFLIVNFGWVLFRAENLTAALSYIKVMLGIGSTQAGLNDLLASLINYKVFWIVGIVGATPLMKNLVLGISDRYQNSAVFYGMKMTCVFVLFILCIIYVVASSYNAFIYFQF